MIILRNLCIFVIILKLQTAAILDQVNYQIIFNRNRKVNKSKIVSLTLTIKIIEKDEIKWRFIINGGKDIFHQNAK
jgi:3-methyladenine DNA glycosylase Mpg